MVRLVLPLLMAFTALQQLQQQADAAGDRDSPGPFDDFGETESDDDSPSVPYHAFLEKFKSRIDHSPTDLTPKGVFDAVRDCFNRHLPPLYRRPRAQCVLQSSLLHLGLPLQLDVDMNKQVSNNEMKHFRYGRLCHARAAWASSALPLQCCANCTAIHL